VAQGLLQHGTRDNPLAKWGRAYTARLGYTTDAHKQAVAGVGKRGIHLSYHLLRTGKAYNGSRYHWNAHQTKMVKQLRHVAARAHDLAREMHTSEVDDTARSLATEAMHAFSSIAGIEGGLTLSANANDEPVSERGFNTRTSRV